MIEKISLTYESLKLVAYKLAIKQLKSESGINKLDVHILLCSAFVTESSNCYATAEAILPLRGRVNISSVYKSLHVLTNKGYIENSKPGKKFVPGEKGWYLITISGKKIIRRFYELCVEYRELLISTSSFKKTSDLQSA